MKKILSLNFLIYLIISFFIFSGIEQIFDKIFGIDLHHIISFGGVGTIILLGFKFHVFCCIIPAAVSTLICVKKKHSHCNCNNHK